MVNRRNRVEKQLRANPFLPVSTAVANVLREDILTCRFMPNCRLKEDPLAEEMSVSRTTVRRAIEVLMNEGLIIKNDGQGVRVVGYDDAAAKDLNSYRRIIEPIIVKIAAKCRTDADLRFILHRLNAMESISDNVQYIEADIGFHESIYRATHNQYLISAGQIYLDGIYRHKMFWPCDVMEQYRSEIHADHTRIFQAIEACDPEKAYIETIKHAKKNYSQLIIQKKDSSLY